MCDLVLFEVRCTCFYLQKMLKNTKNAFFFALFFKKNCVCVRATPSHFTTQLYLRTPPWSALCLTNSPEATVAKCSPYASFSAQKMLKNTKNAFFLHFFSKIFGHVHFLLYLCTRFRKGSRTYGHGAIV